MAAVTVRNLSDEVHRALKHRAKQHGKSTEAEIRAILEQAVMPEGRIKLGSALRDFGLKHGPIEIERDDSPARFVRFE